MDEKPYKRATFQSPFVSAPVTPFAYLSELGEFREDLEVSCRHSGHVRSSAEAQSIRVGSTFRNRYVGAQNENPGRCL
jgi:hypothetical protein